MLIPFCFQDAALIYLLSGTLVISQKITDSGHEVTMFVAHPGEIVGGLAVLTGEPSFFSIRAKHASRIAMLSKTTFYRYIQQLCAYVHATDTICSTCKSVVLELFVLMAHLGCLFVVTQNKN